MDNSSNYHAERASVFKLFLENDLQDQSFESLNIKGMK